MRPVNAQCGRGDGGDGGDGDGDGDAAAAAAATAAATVAIAAEGSARRPTAPHCAVSGSMFASFSFCSTSPAMPAILLAMNVETHACRSLANVSSPRVMSFRHRVHGAGSPLGLFNVHQAPPPLVQKRADLHLRLFHLHAAIRPFGPRGFGFGVGIAKEEESKGCDGRASGTSEYAWSLAVVVTERPVGVYTPRRGRSPHHARIVRAVDRLTFQPVCHRPARRRRRRTASAPSALPGSSLRAVRHGQNSKRNSCSSPSTTLCRRAAPRDTAARPT